MGTPELSVVIPAYNEGERLAATLRALADATAAYEVETIVVDDGSRDGTAAVAHAILDDQPRGSVIRFEANRGKGAAVRAGVLASTGAAVLYMDADLATDLAALPEFLTALADADIVVGSRTLPDAVVRNGTPDRALMAWVFNRIVRVCTGIRSRDTQCGFKMLRGNVAHEIFSLTRCDKFAFDVEVLLLAKRLGLRVVERPVVWTAVEGSSVRRGADSAQAAYDVVRMALHWRPARVHEAVTRLRAGATADEA